MLNIGIFGAPLDDPNLGCVALCYSTIVMLERVREMYGIDLCYTVFDYSYKEEKFIDLCRALDLGRNRISYCKRGNMSDPLRMVKHMQGNYQMKRGLKFCDAVIDLTEGDSFSDIYGDVIFKGKTNVKLLIERKGIPLIIGPQTIGPFYKEGNQKRAAKAINNASLVIARDSLSANCVSELGRKDVVQTIDLAFMLPYDSNIIPKAEGGIKTKAKKKVGINVSSMLFSEENEMKVQRFALRTDYRSCIELILDSLLQSGEYEIYFIPHVAFDDQAHQELQKRYPTANRIPPQSNPVKIKSIISNMDFFIGSRMHATIAAFSSGVPCIPMSYSRKFTGLFNSIGYNHVIDLEKMDTTAAVKLILEKVKNIDSLRENLIVSKKTATALSEKTVERIGEKLLSINQSKNRG